MAGPWAASPSTEVNDEAFQNLLKVSRQDSCLHS
jgi:hypothetical protein